ncbi:reverse transcriptase family protein [Vibrio fluvialis]|nr:reverse transcriptase family protein [Vibrio fluvialis]MBY7870199.1 reverse transcriptase family protein [Vibrio fluvialis]
MKRKKITVRAFLSILSDDPHDRAELSLQPIKSIEADRVTECKIGSKTVFKLKDAKLLEQYQDRVNQRFLSNIEVSNSAIAYVKNKSYLDLFEPHIYGYHFLRVDIKSYFHSISRELIKTSFSTYINDEDFIKGQQKLIDAFTNILTLNVGDKPKNNALAGKEILPIGFKTSPAVSNIIFRRFDNLIQSLCSKNHITYTRYADDMLFSSPLKFKFIHTRKFMDELSYILSLGGFLINDKKTVKEKHMISLNGYVIESNGVTGQPAKIRISNRKTNIIAKLINKLDHNVDCKLIMSKLFNLSEKSIKVKYKKGRDDFIDQYYRTQLINVISGYRAYLISIIKFNCKYNCIDKNHLSKYQLMINKLEKHLLRLSNW